jgi:hypothetical protein
MQHEEDVGTRKDLALYRLETAKAAQRNNIKF